MTTGSFLLGWIRTNSYPYPLTSPLKGRGAFLGSKGGREGGREGRVGEGTNLAMQWCVGTECKHIKSVDGLRGTACGQGKWLKSRWDKGPRATNKGQTCLI